MYTLYVNIHIYILCTYHKYTLKCTRALHVDIQFLHVHSVCKCTHLYTLNCMYTNGHTSFLYTNIHYCTDECIHMLYSVNAIILLHSIIYTHDHVHMHAHACNLPVCLIYYQLYNSIIHQSPIKVDGIFRLNHWRGWTNKGMGMGGSVQTASDINPRLSCAYAIHYRITFIFVLFMCIHNIIYYFTKQLYSTSSRQEQPRTEV